MAFEDLTLKESSSIAAAAYDRDEQTLRITFRPGKAEHQGRSYDYLKTPPEVVGEFLDAESHGQFVNLRIKPNYDCREVM
jgi:KTSC domain-containing protein